MTKQVAPLSRFAFATSGVPTLGIVANGIDYFLFFFYTQMIGLSPALAGFALAVALVFDAVSDPAIATLSDNWQSRLGRRHPFMYASIAPLTVLYMLIWYPPGDSGAQWTLFSYLLAVTILLRVSMAMFDAPVRTMVAELTSDYDERTRLASLPTTVGWITSSVVSIAMYSFWLSDPAENINGQLITSGYQQAGLISGAVILVSLLVATVGLHPEIPRLHMRTSEQATDIKSMFRSLAQLLQNRSLRALLLSGLFVSVGLAIDATLWIYQYSFFYGMSSYQNSILAIVQVIATFTVIPIVRLYVVKDDKKVMAIRFIFASVAISIILPPLLIMGALPPRGSTGLMYLLIVYDFFSQLIWVVAASIIYSMYADVTDEVLLRAGKRLEAATFAGQAFVTKVAAALGALFAGTLLALIHFPNVTDNAPATDADLTRLGLIYTISWLVLASIGIWFISRYEITRSTHAAEIATLEEAMGG